MKTGIHPEYKAAKITCACGRVTETYATVDELHVEICSHCHPFFTGKQKLIDTAGRVERFRRKYRADGSTSVSQEEAPTPEVATAPEEGAAVPAEEAAVPPEEVISAEVDDGTADEADASSESTEA